MLQNAFDNAHRLSGAFRHGSGVSLRCLMYAEPGEHARNANERPVEAKSQPEIVVGHLSVRRIPWASSVIRSSPKKCSRSWRANKVHQHITIAKIRRRYLTNYPGFRVDQVEVTVGGCGLGVRGKFDHRLANCRGHECVIGTQVAQHLTLCHSPAFIQGIRLPHVLLAFPMKPVAVVLQNCRCHISGPIVQNDQFNILVVLIQNTFNGLGQIARMVVSRDDNRNQRIHLVISHMLGADHDTFEPQHVAQHPTAAEWAVQMRFVGPSHQRQVLVRCRARQIVQMRM